MEKLADNEIISIEEAIKHCYEVAGRKCDDCGKEHLQLAKWLEELKKSKAEIERRKAEKVKLHTLIPKMLVEAKSEAYREFAKYLTKHIKDELEQCGNPNHDTQPIAYGTVLGLKSALSFVETAPIILESDVPDKTATSVSLIDGHIEGGG